MKNSNLSSLTTERRNENAKHIHQADTLDILKIMNEEDKKVAEAVEAVLPDVKTAVDYAVESLQKGGRIIYIGAGTSGRLGVLDAAECPPTFSISPDTVKGLIAGGQKALFEAVEGAEDREELGAQDLKSIHLSNKDTVIGIAASGRTPYVHGALKYAGKTGAKTISLTCNKQSAISQAADHSIEVIVGPEVIAGSTRMKAATAHKMILNMISTTSMIRLGKVYENLMVDVNISNEKLKQRAIRIIQTVTGAELQTAEKTLQAAGNRVKTAIIMIKTNRDAAAAEKLLKQAEGNIEKALTINEKNA
ncbi:N-acetylmuramic acid-6-phosphate etherase [Bacillus glycinifermentans]|uniref:N-acetylmuramic acid 6-phosphate etherase n=1 Tax=Bacillus glycinifermentans TaxID=1664069 RepID=A0A0J6EFI5_9BACI|nr:N-acetylmuramic acid 6-phosphate etherase [Bacillus glycinifermentans]ATH94093.1 N-acetylmuramic acid 6-phosphate etherase [Bacillus glycinifermentans]KMM56130.1 N-acetylmuramic acid-6-phosphate etherase [Bacillus glycinifermentans]KRT94551.1 N-acetylmuramic acid 6-phosphate etherase [Bacillus glycinifermentans]MEC0485974.1 N-acetylmuramic acid 6-phosphate etherase [Bacillus glycinifermentans]MEC0496470.1 N-acetylmuramic acid 6-phosphate etherase [Bacillus glycinifermentans]